MPKGLYFTAMVFFFLSFFLLLSFLTPNLWGHWTDLNQTWTHIHLWLLFENLVRIPPGVYPLGLGQKTLLGTDFELWPKISLQWNEVLTIGKKLVNLQGLLYMPQNLVNFVHEWLRVVGEFLPPPKLAHRTSCRLTFATHFGLIMFAAYTIFILFCALAFHNGLEDRNVGARVNTADDPLRVVKLGELWSFLSVLQARLRRAGSRRALPRI